jgi:hypothetical protein
MKRALFATMLVLTLVTGVLLGIRLDRVHAEGWEWRLRSSAAPPKITYQDRDYSRGTKQEPVEGVSVQGRTPGGGEILDDPDPATETLIWVRDGDDTWVYGLMGGP